MQLTIKPMQPEERLYSYQQSSQIRARPAVSGICAAILGKPARSFIPHGRITSRASVPMILATSLIRSSMPCALKMWAAGCLEAAMPWRLFCKENPDSAFQGNYCEEFGFRIDKGRHSFLIRCNPMVDDYNFYVFCYVKEHLDAHMEKAKNGIRFITPEYRELFRIADGEQIQITRPNGEKTLRTCRYIDETHAEIGSNNLYHICQFAEMMEETGSKVIPMRSSLPKKCFSTLPSADKLIIIQKGEMGYIPSEMQIAGKTAREAADIANDTMALPRSRRPLCWAGSLFGWQTPAADPKNYDDNGNPIKPAKKKNREYER